MSNSTKKTGIVVSHTHWDRAWYLTFQQFRHRMVRMIDRLITLLRENHEYHSFTLDGQTILLDDYLEIKPYNEKVLKQLISSGKLIVGPWYILPDLFLVSGESIIRNIQIGTSTARKYGSTMQEGYVPDPFGHFAQLPQILNQFGITSFIFMRGLDEDGKKTGGSIFEWKAPDGSGVLTTYLADGYFNGAALGYPEQFGRFEGLTPDTDLAKERIRKAIDLLEPLQKESTFLINNGFDHMPEQPELPSILKSINRNGNGTVFKQGTFRDFFEQVRLEEREHEVISGDLLGNADHPILSSVFSTRIYLKQQNHRAQSLMERYLEPFLVWAKQNTDLPDPSDFMQYAWKLLLQNHPHDDICGCSVDGVHEDDETRFRQIFELQQSLMIEIQEHILKKGLPLPYKTGNRYSDVMVFNPNPWETTVRAEARILFANPDFEKGIHLPEEKLKAINADENEIPLQVLSTKENTIRNNFLETSWGRRYDVAFEVTVPPLGYQIVHIYSTGEAAVQASSPQNAFLSVKSGTELKAEGDSYQVIFRDTLTRHVNFVQFEYQSDNGDTYTFGPVPENGTTWATLLEAKPLASNPEVLELTHSLSVRKSLTDSDSVEIPITTRVSLQSNGSVELQISYENKASDGRLRVVLPVGFATKTAFADGHFRIAERISNELRTPESAPERYKSYPGELDYPTHHMNDFVEFRSRDMRRWVATRGHHEFELLQSDENTTSVAITLHRAVGLLSTNNGRIRRVQAGPSIPVPGAQCLRKIDCHIAFGTTTAQNATQVYRQARSFAHPVWVREMPWLPHLKPEPTLFRKSWLAEISNPEVAFSSLRAHEDGISVVLRVYNQTESPQTTTIRVNTGSAVFLKSDLNERWFDDREAKPINSKGEFEVTVNPFEILTLMLR